MRTMQVTAAETLQLEICRLRLDLVAPAAQHVEATCEELFQWWEKGGSAYSKSIIKEPR